MAPKRISYEDIIQFLLDSYFRLHTDRFVVLIGGCACSGKTTLAGKIKTELTERKINCLVVSLDNWLLGLNERKGDETVRERFNYEAIAKSVKKIKNGGKVHTSTYNPKTRLVASGKSSEPLFINKGVCVVDGVVALDVEELRRLSDFNIFVDVGDVIRKQRLRKFYRDYKGCSLEETNKIIEPREMEEIPTVKETKKYADVIYNSEPQDSKK